jgi:rubrerythrin
MIKSTSVICGKLSALDACIQIEEMCASIYYSFAGIFADTPKVHHLWKEMAMEEERHADEFRSAKISYSLNYKSDEEANYLIKLTLAQIKSFNDKIDRDKTTLKDALIMAMIVEKTVEKYHLDICGQIFDPEFVRLLRVMIQYSHGHSKILQLAKDTINTSD